MFVMMLYMIELLIMNLCIYEIVMFIDFMKKKEEIIIYVILL